MRRMLFLVLAVAVLAAGAAGAAVARGGPVPGYGAALGMHEQPMLQAAATYLGLTRAALLTEHRSGKTLAQIAIAKGKTVDGLVDAMVAAGKVRIDQAKAAGRLSADQAAQALKDLQAQVRVMVNRQPGSGPGASGMPCHVGR